MDKSTGASAVTILATGDPEEVRTFSLVLSAAHIPHTLVYDSKTSWELAVSEGDAERARYEITAYIDENLNWPEQIPAADEFQPTFRLMSLFIVGCLGLLHLRDRRMATAVSVVFGRGRGLRSYSR